LSVVVAQVTSSPAYQHGQQQADDIDGDVPLAAVDLLARVVAAAGPRDLLGCFTGWEPMTAAAGIARHRMPSSTRQRIAST
jgi:hypothetical protein